MCVTLILRVCLEHRYALLFINVMYMATIVNNPSNNDAGGMSGVLVGALLVLVIVGALLFVYGFPFAREVDDGKTIIIPDQVNIDVTSPQEN